MDDTKDMAYEANLNKEYEPLTEKHKAVLSLLEGSISSYMKNSNVHPATIQGPYGSGKTQLLYHLFKRTWELGGIGIYTHLERIIPKQCMGPLTYADYLKEIVTTEIESLKSGKSSLMPIRLREYAISRISLPQYKTGRVVLFVDEIEQQYKLLNQQVATDDRSPMREIVARVNNGEAGFYLVLAFAPVSFYEFSKGEAQMGRFLPVILPVVEPRTFRNAFGPIGNLLWWMGKGRYRGVIRTRDIIRINFPNIEEITKKELYDVSESIGPIGEVPALEFENIEKISSFEDFKGFLTNLEPKTDGGELYSGTVKIVKKCKIYDRKKNNITNLFESSLKNLDVARPTVIAYYLSVIADGLSSSEGRTPLFTESDDWRELLNLAQDMILEFEGENDLPSKDLGLLQTNINDFSYNIRKAAETTLLEDGYCLSPTFLRLLFPFPISSPNIVSKKIEEQRENLGDQTYLCRYEDGNTSVLLFLNEDKIATYLSQESQNYLKQTQALLVVNLGGKKEVRMPKLAQWLGKEGRIKISVPNRVLADFLVSFFYWMRNDKGMSLPLEGFQEKLEESQSIPEKDKARKIVHYAARVNEFLNNEMPAFSTKYELSDKTGFDEIVKSGFVPEVIGFSFVDSKNDWQSMYDFRNELEKTQTVLKLSKTKQSGVPTAIENLVVIDRKTKTAMLGATLRRISDSFTRYLPDLSEIVDLISKQEFMTIPSDQEYAPIFEGIFLFLKDWRDPSKAEEEFRRTLSNWSDFIKRTNTLSDKMRGYEKIINKAMIFTYSLEADENAISRISDSLTQYEGKISPYSKFLFSKLLEKTLEVVEPKLNEAEKNFSDFYARVNGKTLQYANAYLQIENFECSTFDFLGKEKHLVKEEFSSRFNSVCTDFSKGAKIDLDSIPDVNILLDSIEELTGQLQNVVNIDDIMKRCVRNGNEINELLKKWGKS